MTRLEVVLDDDEDWGGDRPRLYALEGEADELFVDALARTVSRPGGTYQAVIRDTDGRIVYWSVIDGHITLQQMEEFADGMTLHVDRAGRGGQEIWNLWEVLADGLTLYAVYEICSSAGQRIVDRRYRTHRRAAGDWVDNGMQDPPLELRRLVKAKAEWERAVFNEAFGMDRDAGSRLLRGLGYRKVSNQPEVWLEQE